MDGCLCDQAVPAHGNRVTLVRRRYRRIPTSITAPWRIPVGGVRGPRSVTLLPTRSLADPAVGFGRPTWRSDPSQGTPKTKKKNSLDLAHYFLGSGPKSRTKIKIYKKENKKTASGPWFIMEVHG